MEADFLREYIATFQRWKSKILPPVSSECLVRLFVGFVNLQFCIENKWLALNMEGGSKPLFESILESISCSDLASQSELLVSMRKVTYTVPDELVLELFSQTGIFSKFSFHSDEFTSIGSNITPTTMGTLFEQLTDGRQTSGTFYTPKHVVQFLTQKTFDKKFKSNLSELEFLSTKIIDPACGSGALILGCANELERRFERIHSHRSNFEVRSYIIQQCLHGVDIDQDSLNICHDRLWFWMNHGQTNPSPIRTHQLRMGNSVSGSNPQDISNPIGFEFRTEFPKAFENNRQGFDIVIANPPYVRQESIDKKVKKHVLQHRVFGQTVSGMSDLYTYFIARTRQLLRQGGVSGFICSNTWMDARYGHSVQQEFLTKYVGVEIFGFQNERQFESAEINTVLMFMEKGGDGRKTVDFGMLDGVFKDSLQLLSSRTVRTFTSRSLLERGMNNGTYVGLRWSLFLHAPELYHDLLMSQSEKFAKIDELCQRTLRNNLRVLPQDFKINNEAIVSNPSLPYVKSFKDVKTLRLEPSFHPSISHPRLFDAVNKPTYCRPDFAANRFFSSRIVFIEGGDYFVSDSFFLGKLKSEYVAKDVILSLNSTLSLWFVELRGRKGLGGGLLSYYGPEFRSHFLLKPEYFSTISERFYEQFVGREFGDVFEECGFDKERALLPSHDDLYLPLRSQNPNPPADRFEIDKLAFDVLQLGSSQRNEVYWSLCESVLSRLKKAGSV